MHGNNGDQETETDCEEDKGKEIEGPTGAFADAGLASMGLLGGTFGLVAVVFVHVEGVLGLLLEFLVRVFLF